MATIKILTNASCDMKYGIRTYTSNKNMATIKFHTQASCDMTYGISTYTSNIRIRLINRFWCLRLAFSWRWLDLWLAWLLGPSYHPGADQGWGLYIPLRSFLNMFLVFQRGVKSYFRHTFYVSYHPGTDQGGGIYISLSVVFQIFWFVCFAIKFILLCLFIIVCLFVYLVVCLL